MLCAVVVAALVCLVLARPQSEPVASPGADTAAPEESAPRTRTRERESTRPTDSTSGWVDVHVVDLHGAPVPRAAVEFAVEDDAPTATTDDAGHARLAPVAPGRHVAVARGPGGTRGVSELIEVGAGQGAEARVALEPQCALRVRVIEEDGAPCSGVRVTASQEGSPLQIYELTADDGRCRLDELSAGPWLVRADTARVDAAAATVLLPMDDELLLIARLRASVVGRITDRSTGLPVAGARVGVSERRDVEAWDAVQADAEGRFVAEVPRSLGIEGGFVVASAPGYLPTSSEYEQAALVPMAGHAHHADVRLRPTGTLQVTVLADDGPLAGVELRLEDVYGSRDELRTDASGRISFASAPPGEHVVVDDDRIYDLDPARVVVPAVGQEEVVLHATPRAVASVAGLVVDADGTPLAGAQISSWGVARPIVTDAAGGFTLRLPHPVGTRALRLTVVAPGRAREVHDFPLAEGGSTTVRVVLDRLADFHGRLVDESGAPIRNATLRCTDAASGVRRATLVADDGTFRLTVPQRDAAEDVCALEVLGSTLAMQPFEFRRPVGGPHDLGDVVVLGGKSHVARVVDENGAPVVGATVSGEALYARTDESGAFTYALATGTVRVEIRAVGYVGRSAELTTEAREIVLRRRQDLAGRLLFADGSPVSGAFVRVALDGPVSGLSAAVTDAEGRFVLRDVRARGPVTLVWTPGGNDSPQPTLGFAREVALTGAEPTFRAERGHRVEGVVEDSAGVGVPHATVRADAGGLPFVAPRAATTDSSGHFVIEGVREAEDAVVSVSCELGELELRGVQTARERPLTLRFGRLVATGGVLRLPAGYAIDGEQIRAWPCEPYPEGTIPGAVTVAVRADGSFEFDGVAGITYSLELEQSRRFIDFLAPDARVPAGRRDIAVEAQLGLSIRGVVTDGSGAGLGGVALRAPCGDHDMRATATAADGSFALTGLLRNARPCELYLSRAAADGAPAMELRIDEVAPGTSDVRVIADPSTQLSFRIRSERDFGCDVRVRGPVATAYRHVSRGKNTCEIAWLTPGADYEIAIPSGDGRWTVLGNLRAGTVGAVLDIP